MHALKESQLKKLAEDIATIKEVLAKTRPSVQLLFLPVHYRFMSLVFSLSVFLFCGVYQALIIHYGTYMSIPGVYRAAFLGLLLLDWLGLLFLKLHNLRKSLTSMDPRYSLGRIVKDFITFKTMHSYLIFLASVSFFIIYFVSAHRAYMIIPTLSIGIGLMLNTIGNMTEIGEYILSGSWMLFAGFLIIIMPEIPTAIAIVISFGIGMLLFSVLSYLRTPHPDRAV